MHIKKILIANRGEIAIRIMRSCYEMGIETVAVYSEADRTSKHVFYANEAYCVGAAASDESYLCMDKIIEVAVRCGADAIHPGYGFLSENAEFAKRCHDFGLIFIGPSASVIELMGDKISARRCMQEAGIPVVPGSDGALQDMDSVFEIADKIGFPVMIKASQGGGGKGMRCVQRREDLQEAYEVAKNEALSAFNSDMVYVEKFIENPHHIEFQVLGDSYGNVVHLYERECSIQRRNQKIVEETPSPFLWKALRREMGNTAVKAAKAIGYIGAGTIEFLVDERGNYYFLEMNTRLQVEHPITELTLDIDLVKEQIFIAKGHPLSFQQEDLKPVGHAIECRICAEDPDAGFVPAPGIVQLLTEPSGPGIRLDSYLYEGYEIPVCYDPMLSKLIVWAAKREYAIHRMKRALNEYHLSGTLKTNLIYLKSIMSTPDFVRGKYDIAFIPKHEEEIRRNYTVSNEEVENMTLIAVYIDYLMTGDDAKLGNTTDNRPISRWREFGKRKGVLRI